MKNILIAFFSATLCMLGSSAFATTVQPLDNATVEHTQKGIPYCEKGCDIPEDCINNQPPSGKNYNWTCENAKGFCVGVCKRVPVNQTGSK